MTAARGAAIVVAVAVAIAAWRPWSREEPRPVAWRDLTGRVGPLELARPTTQAFASDGELREFLRAEAAGRLPPLPPIDYRRERATVVSPGPRSSTGYRVDVVRVTTSEDGTLVLLRERTPSLGDDVDPRVTYPYRLLAIATTDDEIAFRWLGRP